MTTTQPHERTSTTTRPASWRTRLAVAGVALALLAAARPGLPATALGSGGEGGAIRPAPLAQSTGGCAIPTAADRPPLSDGTAGSEWVPGLATPGATPVADPADLEAAADIDLVVRAVAACLTAGEYQTVTELAAAGFLGTLAGTGGELDPATYVLIAQDLPADPFRIRSIDAVQVTGESQATADVVYAIANQLFHGRWSFTQVEAASNATGGSPGLRWVVAAEQPLEPDAPEDAVEIEVTLDEYEIALGDDSAAGADVVLAAENAGEAEHEILVLRVESGGDVQDLLTEPGPALPAGLVFAGQITLPPGATATLPLVGLAPGTYALVSLLLDPGGVPDLAQGMQAELTVTE